MTKSATNPKKATKQPTADPVAATVPDRSRSAKDTRRPKPASAARRIPVQYTPRIPAARCPWC